jgi:diguanylate cyclase (GGDEF)-like protein/PAS domain S-box-containing protein
VGTSRSRYAHLDSGATLRQFVRNLKEGIYITSPDGEILDANPAFLEMLGVEAMGDLARITAAELFVDPEERRKELDLLVEEGAVREFEFQIRRLDGEVRTLLDTCYVLKDEESGEIFYHGILIDITERKDLERRLWELSIRDPLTGCFNRRRLDEVAGRLTAEERSWGTIVIDVDHFKSYNDVHGHAAGDEVLMRLSRFIMGRLRPEDPVFRIGGDEFLVLVPDADEDSTRRLAERLRHAARRRAPVPFSLGWAARSENESVDETIARADRGLLQVRAEERGKEGERRREAD